MSARVYTAPTVDAAELALLEFADPVQVSYQATDASGLSTAVFTYRGPTGQTYQVRADGSTANTGPATTSVGTNWPSGTYKLAYVSLFRRHRAHQLRHLQPRRHRQPAPRRRHRPHPPLRHRRLHGGSGWGPQSSAAATGSAEPSRSAGP